MIYDCFTFFNELDLLEIRLSILDEYVDTFVICEGNKTFRGKDKPMYFRENMDRYEKWLDKIVYVEAPMTQRDPWAMEEFQRNWITMGLDDVRAGDLIFISDLDEIWNPDKLDEIAEKSFYGPVKIQQQYYYYYLNLKLDLVCCCTVAVRGIDFIGPQFHRTMGCEPHVLDGGWQWSYLGGVEIVRDKIEAFAHSELDKQQYKDLKHIEHCLANGVDLFGRGDIKMSFVTEDDSLPPYLAQNRDRWSHLYGP